VATSCPGRGAAFFMPLRRAGIAVSNATDTGTPDQQRTTPQGQRAAQHPGNGDALSAPKPFARPPFPTPKIPLW
jgi:hypothetical protein